MSSSNCCFLTCIQISQEADKVVCSHLFQNFPQFVVIHTVKGFGVISKVEVDVFLELSHFFNDPTNIGNLISGSSAFFKSSLNIWKFVVHILLKPGLENFEHYFAIMWNKGNCATDQPRQHIKNKDITLPANVCLVKAMAFPVVMYGCECWTIKKAECRRIDAFEMWCWRRLLRVPWTAEIKLVNSKGN